MAIKKLVTIICDLDTPSHHQAELLSPGKDMVTHRLSFNGVTIEIDLCSTHSEILFDRMADYLKYGRVQAPAPVPGRPRRTQASRRRNKEIRDWAKEQGIKLETHGRIPVDVVALHAAATNGGAR